MADLQDDDYGQAVRDNILLAQEDGIRLTWYWRTELGSVRQKCGKCKLWHVISHRHKQDGESFLWRYL